MARDFVLFEEDLKVIYTVKIFDGMLEKHKKPVLPKLYSRKYFLTGCLGSGVYKKSKGSILDNRLKRCFEVSDIKKGMTVLDVGCGRGELSLNSALNGCKVFSVDYSNDALILTKQTIKKLDKKYKKNILILKMDAKRPAFKKITFDRVLLLDIVEHLHNWELFEVLKAVKNILKKDGKLIIHTSPNVWVYRYGYFTKRIYMLFIKRKLLPMNPRSSHDKKMHVNEQSILSLKALLKEFDSKIWVEFVTTPKKYNIVKFIESSPIFHTPLKYFLCNDIFAVCTKKKN